MKDIYSSGRRFV